MPNDWPGVLTLVCRKLGRSSRFVLGTLALLLPAVTLLAHQDPPGATGTGVNLSLTAFRSDGVTPVFPGTVDGCGETIIYRGTLSWAGGSNAAIQGGTLNIMTPDGMPHDVTPAGGIPCLGGTDGVICTPGVTSVVSEDVQYTVTFDPACTPGTTITASITYADGIAHVDADDLQGVGAMVPFQLGITCCPTPTPTNTPTNTPTDTPTNTPTNTPTDTPTNTPTNTPTLSEGPPPTVPTLSFPMLALLGLLLAGAGFYVMQRN
jgi:hypothetical protein